MQNTFADFLLKYNGWALSSEYINRSTSNPFTVNTQNDTVCVYTGWGLNTQLSYCFKNNYELAVRYAFVKPDTKVRYINPENNTYALGISKYIKKHLFKIQSNLTYNYNNYFQEGVSTPVMKDKWLFQFQIEMGI